MPSKDYVTDGVTVHWRSARCIHSRNCVHGLPEVFDLDVRPWVRVERADADAIADAVDRCPSRALTYTRTDGASGGSNAARPDEDAASSVGAEVQVNVRAKGPLAIVGAVEVVDADGAVLSSEDRTFLCRCGGSGNKPFCDGTHKRVGFVG